MELTFKIIKHKSYPPQIGRLIAYLCEDNWDDYDFKTAFSLIVFDENDKQHNLGNVKIGIVGFEKGWVSERIGDNSFTHFTDQVFSLGQDQEYYKNIRSLLSNTLGNQIFEKLNDVAYSRKSFDIAFNESIFKTSLLRSVSTSVIHGQFSKIIKGEATLSEFDFSYKKMQTDKSAQIDINFR